jgi:hypothetical protein
MSSRFHRDALAALLGLGACLGAGAQTSTGTPPPAASSPPAQAAGAHAQPAAASAPTDKKKGSRAKTPPGKPPAGFGVCNQGTKAQQQRCLNDMYGPGAPRL